jgi:hypothetical protein
LHRDVPLVGAVAFDPGVKRRLREGVRPWRSALASRLTSALSKDGEAWDRVASRAVR